MARKVGLILGIFFIVIGFLRLPFKDTSQMGYILLGVGLLFIICAGERLFQKAGQILIFTFCGCYLVSINNPANTSPMLGLALTLMMFINYFPKRKKQSFLLMLPYILTALLCSWSLFSITAMIIAYITFTTLIYVLNSNKK